jgi:diadenosine tetraphosphate (Ap4A) HIT family hydrolase
MAAAFQMTCVFCNEPRDAGELIFEDERVLVLLHDDWAVPGHAMVIWREHVENVAGLTPEEYAHFAAVHHRVERALLDVTRADRAVLLKLGIITPHLHLHIYPVSATLDRAQVMEIVDGQASVVMGDEDRRAFADDLRERLS